MAGFVERTRQGIQALAAAVGRSTREPERAAYLVAADTNTLASLVGWSPVKKATKPALMPLLTGGVWRSGAPDRVAGVIGLAGGWAGDLALMKPGNIRAGASGFAVNHAVYIFLLLNRGARPGVARVAIRTVPLAAATILAARKAPGLLPVMLGYGGLLATTSVLADDPALINPKEPATYGLGHGGNLFLISDAVLFARETLLAPGTTIARVADAAVMGTYTVAQLLLIDGLFPSLTQKSQPRKGMS